MKTVANVLWIIFGGLALSAFWAVVGLISCLTIIGIPFGKQCFKFANLMLFPFGRDALTPQDLSMLRTLAENFKHRDTSDEVTCLIHSDIGSQNIVYNAKTKQFGLIDFESLETNGKTYYGFTSKTFAANGIPYDLLSRIADRYNEISDIKISKEKIKLFHKVGTIYEMATNAKYRLHMSGDDVKKSWEEHVKARLERIDRGFEK